MSRMLKRRAHVRPLRLESLEPRAMMHAGAEDMAVHSHQDHSAPSVVQTLETSSVDKALKLDADDDGRVSLTELRTWLTLWKARRTPNPAPAAAPKPDVLPSVDTFGGSHDWYLNTVNAPESWAAGFTGEGVTIAVIDTGADLRHPDLQGQLWTNPDEIAGNGRDDDGNGLVDDVQGWDFANDDPIAQDRNGHGTHVASLLASSRDGRGATGVAYGAELMVLQGLGSNGVGDSRDIARAMRYAVDEGADIINVSLSGVASSSIDAALQYAAAHDVLVVAAAGNEGAAAPSAPASSSRRLNSVISVGAVDQHEQLASFSNRAGDAVQIVAPGVRLRAAVPDGYALYSGTSMAAPVVAGVAALAMNAAPQLSAAQIRDLLVSGARSIPGDDSHGLVNAAVTVAQALKAPIGSTPIPLVSEAAAPTPVSRSVVAAQFAGPVGFARFASSSESTKIAALDRAEHDESGATDEQRLSPLTPALPTLRLWKEPDEVETAEPEMRCLDVAAIDEVVRRWAA